MVKLCSLLLFLSVVAALCITEISSDSVPRIQVPPLDGNEACRKMPSNWESINLQCGGYGHEDGSCGKVCSALRFSFAHCGTQKYCLCHNGPRSQCYSNSPRPPVAHPIAPAPFPEYPEGEDAHFPKVPTTDSGACRKVPADWQSINLHCGGYSSVDNSCHKVCESLRFSAGYCGTQKYCLCHDRHPSQCLYEVIS